MEIAKKNSNAANNGHIAQHRLPEMQQNLNPQKLRLGTPRQDSDEEAVRAVMGRRKQE